MRRALLVAILLSLTLVPTAHASGGVIDSVTVTGNNVIGAGPISVNISIIGTGGASSASVNWTATLTDIEGNLIDSDSGNSLVNDSEIKFVETMLGDAPLGYSNLTVTLTGDVGTPGSEQFTIYQSTIHRLRPLDISLSAPTFTGVDLTGNATSNLTINDGDKVRIDVPVINNGDVEWNGSLNLTLDSVPLTPQTVNISGDTTSVYSFITDQISEGIHSINASLYGSEDSDVSDNYLNSDFEVGPPPLPALLLQVQRATQPQPGSIMSWNLTATNSGEVEFIGDLVCWFDGEQIFNQNSSIAVSSSVNYTVNTNSKPGELICSSDGSRTSSTINASDTIEMTSAIFVGAGHSSPTLLAGPWHVGDDVLLSMLIRNEGDAEGSATLRLEIAGFIENGTTTTLDEGKAGELSHVFNFLNPGEHVVNWSVHSNDGAVDSNLSGSIIIPILPSQVISLEIESVDVGDDGFLISWGVELSEGRDRIVVFNFGSISDNIENEPLVEERNLLPGVTYGVTNIGLQDGDQVYAEVKINGWVVGSGSILEQVDDMPDTSVIPQVTVNPSTQPKVPTAGEKVTLSYTLSNSGDGITPEGQIVIIDDKGIILASVTSPETSASSIDQNSIVTWPNGDNVKIMVYWHVDGKTASDDVMIISESVESESEEFTIPWGGILGGLAVGFLLIFAVRIKNSPKSEKKEKKKPAAKKASGDEKVEVACPSCDRRLRVPSTYSGAVKCPECDTKFDVEATVEEEEPVPQKNTENEQSDDDLWSSSDNDVLPCPKCTRKLKVPIDRRPAKARCPACEAIFEARAE